MSGSFEPLDFPGAALDWGREHYLLRLERPHQFLSSALLGEGFVETRWVYSQQVKADAPLPEPEVCLLEGATARGVPQEEPFTQEPFIGLLTAVSHQDLQVKTMREAGVIVTAQATAGVDRGSSPLERQGASYGEPVPQPSPVPQSSIIGTINIVTLVDADLTPGALVRASTLATEAKTLALVEAGVRTRQGHLATGTSTDVTVVGHSGRGKRFKYAGSATLVGWLVGQAAYHCVTHGLAAYNKRVRFRATATSGTG